MCLKKIAEKETLVQSHLLLSSPPPPHTLYVFTHDQLCYDMIVHILQLTFDKCQIAFSQWRIMDRRLNMRFTVPGASNEKSIFCQSDSFRQ